MYSRKYWKLEALIGRPRFESCELITKVSHKNVRASQSMAVCCWLGKCALDLLNTIKRWCSRFLKRPLGISYAAYFEVFIHYLPFMVPPDLFGTNINYLPNRAKSRSSKWFHLLACRGRSADRTQLPLAQNPHKSVSQPFHAV